MQQAMTILTEGETELAMYAQAGAEGEAVAAIPAGATLIVKEVGAEWTLVQYGEFTGYVPTSKIALLNPDGTQAPTEETPVVRSITITSSLEGESFVDAGTVVTFKSTLVGFEDDVVVYQWQRSLDDTNWEDVEGANEAEYSFALDQTNDMYYWRLTVSVLTPEASAAPEAEPETVNE